MNHHRANQIMREHRLQERLGLIPPTPARITTRIVRPNPALLDTKQQRDTFADSMLLRERQRLADIELENLTEGRPHPVKRINPHGD